MGSTESFTSSQVDRPARPAHRTPTALKEDTPSALRSAAEDVASSVEQLYRVGDAFLGRQAQERPHLVLGAAAGIGFILGGGLAWKVAGAVVNVVGRMAVTHAVDGWISTVARASEPASRP